MDQSCDKYTIVIVYDNKKDRENSYRELDLFFNQLSQEGKGETGAVHISYFRNDENSSNRYIACIPKEMNDYLNSDEGKKLQEDKKWGIKRYNPQNRNQRKTNNGDGFFIDEYKEEFVQLMKYLTGKFVIPNSYDIITPPDDQNGNKRNYILVKFRNNKNGYTPRKFIKKLKALLDDTPLARDDSDPLDKSRTLRIRWAKRGVLNDVSKGVNKEIKVSS